MATAGYSSTGSGGVSFGKSPFARSVTLFYQSKANPLLTVDFGFPAIAAMAGLAAPRRSFSTEWSTRCRRGGAEITAHPPMSSGW